MWNVNTAGYLNNNNANYSYAAQPDCAAYFPQNGPSIARVRGNA